MVNWITHTHTHTIIIITLISVNKYLYSQSSCQKLNKTPTGNGSVTMSTECIKPARGEYRMQYRHHYHPKNSKYFHWEKVSTPFQSKNSFSQCKPTLSYFGNKFGTTYVIAQPTWINPHKHDAVIICQNASFLNRLMHISSAPKHTSNKTLK